MVFSCTLAATRAELLIQRKQQLATAEAARAAEQLAAKGPGSHLAVWWLNTKQLNNSKRARAGSRAGGTWQRKAQRQN